MSVCFPVLGVFVGVMYVLIGFSGRAHDPPTLAITIGPFRQGCLYLGGYHVHHWCIYGLLSLLATTLHFYNLAAFSFIMTVHGLSYPDCFEFAPSVS